MTPSALCYDTTARIWGLEVVLTRLRLRHAALRFAAHGWQVTPGAWLRTSGTGRSGGTVRTGRFDCGRLGCPTTACHPALADWEQAASCDPVRIAEWWRYAPHGVLLPTGLAFDVLEVPAPLGARAVGSPAWRATGRGPVATTPTGRWMFFVGPGHPLVPELAGRLDVIRHARGSWVPAPPTRLVEGPVQWAVPPPAVAWRLPDGDQVQCAVRAAAGAAGPAAVARRVRMIGAPTS